MREAKDEANKKQLAFQKKLRKENTLKRKNEMEQKFQHLQRSQTTGANNQFKTQIQLVLPTDDDSSPLSRDEDTSIEASMIEEEAEKEDSDHTPSARGSSLLVNSAKQSGQISGWASGYLSPEEDVKAKEKENELSAPKHKEVTKKISG